MKFKTLLVIGILILALFVVGCKEDTQGNQGEKLDVVVSLLPQKAFVEAVGGDLVNVKELIPKGASPATYEPMPSDLVLVEKADIYFRIGHIPFEKSHIAKLIELNPNMKVVDTSANVDLRNFEEHESHSHGHEEDNEEGYHYHDKENGEHDLEEECSEHNGTWIEEHEECEGIGEDDCEELGGHFSECESACRNDPGVQACTLQCVLVCSFEEHDEHEEEYDDVERMEDRHVEEGEEHMEDEHEDEHKDDHGHDHTGVDPHIWLSPMQVKKQIDSIAQTLSQEDPTNADTYSSNAENFKKELAALHSEIESELSELKTDKLMVFHPAWGYFADEYGLEQIAIEQSGKEPTAKELEHLIEEAKEEEIKVIFVQSQFNRDIAESVAEEVGAIVVSIDPLSADYIDNLRNVAITIAESLNK